MKEYERTVKDAKFFQTRLKGGPSVQSVVRRITYDNVTNELLQDTSDKNIINSPNTPVPCPGPRELRIKVVSSNYSTVSVGEGNKLLDPKTWYTIGVVAVRPRFMGKSSVIVYLNGEIYFQGNLPFVHPRTRVDRCTFGENMNGKMGPTLISNENTIMKNLMHKFHRNPSRVYV